MTVLALEMAPAWRLNSYMEAEQFRYMEAEQFRYMEAEQFRHMEGEQFRYMVGGTVQVHEG